MEDDQTGDESSHSVSPSGHPRGKPSLRVSESQTLADNLEAQFQPVTVPSDPAVIEMFGVSLKSHIMSPASKPNLTNPEEFQEAIRGLKVGKAPGPNGIPNRALKHLPQRAVSLLVLIFNAILVTHHFPSVEASPSDLYT